jgi:ribosome-binding protein aMBF1 (putative translation factor)
VIKNEKQYRITRAQARRFEEAIAELARQQRPANISPRLWRAQHDAAESQLRDLREQLAAYEKLGNGETKDLTLDAVEELPKTLIRARIAAGMTQENLAHRLGLKTQQIQRYEATEYESASFARIRQVVQVLGIRLPRPAKLVRR